MSQPTNDNTTAAPQQLMNCFTVMLNITLTMKICYVTTVTLISVFVVTSNSLLILGILKNYRQKMTISKKLFLFLSVNDLFTGCSAVPIQLVVVSYGSRVTCFLVKLQVFLSTFTPGISMLTILSISVVRYLSVAKPMFHMKHTDNPWIFIMIMGNSLIALSIALWYAMIATRGQLGWFLIFITGFCFSVIGGAVLLNIFLLIKLHTTPKLISAEVRDQEIKKKNQTSATKTIAIISVILTMCYLPNRIVFGIVGYFLMVNHSYLDMYNVFVPWFYLPMV